VAPKLPDRYQTQVRLGRDGDVEEWLATDTSLDRPVLVRALDPAADPARRTGFVHSVRSAAAVGHIHLTRIYEVNDSANVYAIIEWNGGVSIADRLRAGDTLPVHEFLPNAAGLAEGLAALHAAGAVHGSVDTGAIRFSSAHPAKLGAFGRPQLGRTPADDTRGLAVALRQALTGSSTPDLRPSQVVEGLPRSVDDAIAAAERGTLTAATLAASLRAAPFRPETVTQESWSWRWVPVSLGLLAAAMLISLVGLTIDVDPDSPFLFPATPQVAGGAQPTADDGPTPTDPEPADVIEVTATSFDPFGDNLSEREGDVPLAHDGDPDTAWRTERYFSPLPGVKPGVGIVFTVDGVPSRIDLEGSPDTAFQLGWSASAPAGVDDWEELGSGTLTSDPTTLEVPERDPGVWVLWLTDIPEQADGEYWADIAEVTFTS